MPATISFVARVTFKTGMKAVKVVNSTPGRIPIYIGIINAVRNGFEILCASLNDFENIEMQSKSDPKKIFGSTNTEVLVHQGDKGYGSMHSIQLAIRKG